MKKTEFNTDGLPIGHYDTDIHGKNIPAAAVKITDKEYQDMIDNPGNRKRDNGTGKIIPIISDLDKSKAERKNEIEIEANELIDIQIGTSPRDHMMMIASGIAMLDKQVGRGGSSIRDPKQDELVNIFEYVGLVRTNKQVAFDAIDAASDPSIITLTHPSLPK